LRIVFLGTYAPTNLGNYFIDLGSQYSFKCLKRYETLDLDLNYVSGFPTYLFEQSSKRHWLIKKIAKIYNLTINKVLPRDKNKVKDYGRDKLIKPENTQRNLFNLVKYLKPDFLVFSGCVLNNYSIRRFGPILREAKKEGAKIIFNGAGGSSYVDREIHLVSNFLKKLDPYAFISRDETAYKNYQDFSRHSYNGIDCAFFLDEFYEGPDMDLDYVIYTFDKTPEPDIELDQMIVRLHHAYYPEIDERYLDRSNTLITDNPSEMLGLYANADHVYSDRIHACVPSISLGSPASFYFETARARLFERVGIDIEDKPLRPDRHRIKKEKEAQTRFLRELVIKTD